MYRPLIRAAYARATTFKVSRAQVDLSTYADANGFLNVQKLTCCQLAGTGRETLTG